MRNKDILVKKVTMRLVGAACSFALSACGGGSDEASITTMFKELLYLQCSANDSVANEVKLIADAGIHPVKRRCNHVTPDRAYVAACGTEAYFAYSVLDVMPSEVAKTKSIGYTEQLRATQTYDPANDFACN